MVGQTYAEPSQTGYARAPVGSERAGRTVGRSCSTSTSISVGRRVSTASRFTVRAGRARRPRRARRLRASRSSREAIVGQLGPERRHDLGRTARPLPPGRVDRARDSGVGYVPEDRHASGFCGNLSVEENIALPVLAPARAAWGFISPGAPRRELADAMIATLEIKVSDPAQNASELSGGNQQKTVMGRALASDPSVLVLGHPTAGVDIASKEALFDIIRAHATSAVLLVSDEIDELAICDRVLVMFAGRIVREFAGAWQEHEMVAAMEGVGR